MRVPCIPGMPSHCSWSAGNAPSPISVQVTGKRSEVQSSMNSLEAFAFTIPPPP